MQNLKLKKQNRWVTKWPKKVRVQLAVLRFEAVNIQPDSCAKTVLPSWKLLRTDHSSSTQEKFSDYVWWLMDHSDHFPTRTKSFCFLSEASITCALAVISLQEVKTGERWNLDHRRVAFQGWGDPRYLSWAIGESTYQDEGFLLKSDGHLHLFKSSGWPLEGSLVFASQRGLCSKECLSLSCLAQR